MKLKKIILLILLWNVTNEVFCQVIDAKLCNTGNRFPVTKYFSYLQTTQPISIDSVIRSNSFTAPADNPVMVFNYDPYYYWFRMILKNSGPAPQELMLLMAPVGMQDGRLYQKQQDQWTEVAHSGLKYKFTDRSYQFAHYVFPFSLQQNSLDTLYLRVDAKNLYKVFGFTLLKPQELKVFENKIYFVFGIMVGLLLLFFALNISLFFALKEKLHLWYALYIAMLFFIVMKNDQLDQEFFHLDSESAFRLSPYMSIGALSIVILMHVVQGFFKDVLAHQKLLYKLSLAFKINLLLVVIIHASVFLFASDHHIHAWVFRWAKLSTVLGICITVANCVYALAKGHNSALFLLSGPLVFMIGAIQRLYFPGTLSFLFPPTTFHIGIIIEVFVISMGLIYRYWSEKETQRRNEVKIQLQITNDISEEIHDNVGQTLTLANLYLKTMDYNDITQIRNKVNDSKNLISKGIYELRNLSRSLKNESVADKSIVHEIEKECMALEKSGLFHVKFNSNGDNMALEHKKQAILIRVVKEALQNIIKHAKASKVDISLSFKSNKLSILIKDDGVGFNYKANDASSNGLNNIKNRCLMLNATCHIETEPKKGTEINIQLPI